MVRTIYQQLSPEEVHAQADRVVAQLREHFPQAAQMLEDALPDILAFTAFPVSHWQKLWSNNPMERAEGRRYLTIAHGINNETLPATNILEAAA